MGIWKARGRDRNRMGGGEESPRINLHIETP